MRGVFASFGDAKVAIWHRTMERHINGKAATCQTGYIAVMESAIGGKITDANLRNSRAGSRHREIGGLVSEVWTPPYSATSWELIHGKGYNQQGI